MSLVLYGGQWPVSHPAAKEPLVGPYSWSRRFEEEPILLFVPVLEPRTRRRSDVKFDVDVACVQRLVTGAI
jgi:hypothetical protein